MIFTTSSTRRKRNIFPKHGKSSFIISPCPPPFFEKAIYCSFLVKIVNLSSVEISYPPPPPSTLLPPALLRRLRGRRRERRDEVQRVQQHGRDEEDDGGRGRLQGKTEKAIWEPWIAVHFPALFRSDLQRENGRHSPGFPYVLLTSKFI